jgi:hypothetical protein
MELFVKIIRSKSKELYKDEKTLADFPNDLCSFRMFSNRSNIHPHIGIPTYQYFTADIGIHRDRNAGQFYIHGRMSL